MPDASFADLAAELDAKKPARVDPAKYKPCPTDDPPGVGFHTIPDSLYYADPCAVPSLSKSIASVIADRSPAHAWIEHPRLGGTPRKATDATDRGNVIEAFLLGVGEDRIEVIDAKNYQTKAAQQERDFAREAGKIPLLPTKLAEYETAAKRIRERIEALGIDLWSRGRRQVAMVWEADGVLCRGKTDYVEIDAGEIWDLKTLESAAPADIDRHMVDYAADIQWAAYTEGLETLCDSLRGRVSMGFLYAEYKPPYAVTPVRVAGTMAELGRARWKRAKDAWRQALAKNYWPTFIDRPGAFHYADAPRYALAREGVEI